MGWLIKEMNQKKKFVSTVIDNIIAQYYEQKIKIKKEQVNSDVRAQIIMQLYNPYFKIIKLGASKDHIVYGIVTTGQLGIFWCKGNGINNSNNIKSSIIWKYEEILNPIETSPKRINNNGKKGWHYLSKN